MRAFLARIPRALLARWRRRPFRTPRDWAFVLLPWALLLAGLLLIFVSMVPEVRTADSVLFVGSLAPRELRTETVTQVGFTYAEIAFEGTPPCGVRLYVLDSRGGAEYRASGALPDPESSLNCERTSAVYQGDIDVVVFQNAFAINQSFAVRFDLVLVSQPNALLALPAFALFLFGGALVIMRSLHEGLVRTVEDLAEQETYEPPHRGEGGRP